MLGAGLALALLSAFALNWGFFTQHGAASELPPLTLRQPVRSLRMLLADRRWLAGFLVGLAGWAFYILALRLAPLSLVQAVAAGGLGVLALLVALSPGSPGLARREWTAVGVSVGGLALLGLSLAGGNPAGSVPSATAVAAWLAVLSLTAGAIAASIRAGVPAAVALGLAAGILYATGDVATKAAVASAALLVFVPAVLAAHGLAFVTLQLGFQRGGALVTVGLATLLTNSLPIAAGTFLFGEGIPAGAAGVLRVASFGLVVAGAVLLARPGGEPERPAEPVGRMRLPEAPRVRAAVDLKADMGHVVGLKLPVD
jgi:hypothetical protein